MAPNMYNFENTTHALSERRLPRHINYVTYLDAIVCYQPPIYAFSQEEACVYVKTSRGCNDIVEIINYLDIFVCKLNGTKNIFGIFLVTLLILAFMVLYITILFLDTQFFLVPNLLVIFERIGVPEYEFGMILLTIFFLLPSTFRTFLKCQNVHHRGSLLLAQHLGKLTGFYVYGFLVLSLTMRYTFGGIRHMRSSLITMLGLFYVYQLLHFRDIKEYDTSGEKVTLTLHAWICLLIYAAFMIFTALHSRIYKKPTMLNRLSHKLDIYNNPELSEISSDDEIGHTMHLVQRATPWTLFVRIINPFPNMKNMPIYAKVICSPQYSILACLIPVVDSQRHMNGWCLLVVCSSILSFPWQMSLLGITTYEFIALFIITLLIVMFVLILTNIKRVPRFHDAFALWGLFVSLTICSICNAEIDTIMWQFGSYLENWRGDILKLVFFSLGEHFVEVLLTVNLIRRGYYDMAYGFVVGLSIFMVYIPLPSLVLQFCFKEDNILTISANTETCYIFLMIVMITNTLGMAVCDFNLRPSHGLYLTMSYLIYLLYLFLTDQRIIHAYGSAHAELTLETVIPSNWA